LFSIYSQTEHMLSLGINGEQKSGGQSANPRSPGEVVVKQCVCVYVCVIVNEGILLSPLPKGYVLPGICPFVCLFS